jgi:hypothetical protein
MSTPLGPILSMWEAEGNRHASAFDACAGAVVIGERPTVAAEVALGIARVQARRRRVAIADTVGELGPLEDLVPMDAPYGLVDSFFYGVSLNKIAYTVDPAKNLIIFPSGAVPVDHEALLGSDRWGKLVEAFRAADGLLLVVAPAESSALSSLIEAMDGVVLVGNVAAAPGTRVLAHARAPMIPSRLTPASVAPVAPTFLPRAATPFPPPPVFTPNTPKAPPTPPPQQPPPSRQNFREVFAADARKDDESEAPEAQAAAVEEPAPVVEAPTAPVEPIPRRVEEPRHAHEDDENLDEIRAALRRGSGDSAAVSHDAEPHVATEEGPQLVPPWARDEEYKGNTDAPIENARTVTFWIAIVAGAIVAAALLTWISTSVMSRNDGADTFAVHPDSVHGATRVIAAPAPTAPAARRDTAPAVAKAAVAPAVSTPAPYSVVLADVASMTGANGELDQASGRGFPAATYAPYRRPDGAMSYVVITGAYADSAGADTLLRTVRAKRYRTAAAAHVVKLPYAVMVQKGVTQDQAPMFVRAYLSKGLPVYPLLQADGTVSLWAGAFRSAEQAQPLVTSFRANGDQPTVMIRTGRTF